MTAIVVSRVIAEPCSKGSYRALQPITESIFTSAGRKEHLLFVQKMYYQPDYGRILLMDLIFKKLPGSFRRTNISKVEMLSNLIVFAWEIADCILLVYVKFSYCQVISLIDILVDIFHSPHQSINFNVYI